VTAERYTSVIITYCEALQTFPHRDNRRDDIRKSRRVTKCHKRVVIAFDVDAEQVSVIGVSMADRTVVQGDTDDL
jgi:toxin ParE1/3/4